MERVSYLFIWENCVCVQYSYNQTSVLECLGSLTILFSTKLFMEKCLGCWKNLVLDSWPNNLFMLIPVWSVIHCSGDKEDFSFQTKCCSNELSLRTKVPLYINNQQFCVSVVFFHETTPRFTHGETVLWGCWARAISFLYPWAVPLLWCWTSPHLPKASAWVVAPAPPCQPPEALPYQDCSRQTGLF